MKRFIKTVTLLTLASCGADTSHKAVKPLIGTEGLQSYFTDRNITGEDLQNFENDVAGKVGAKAELVTGENFQKGTNKIASDVEQSAVDNNMTGEDIQNGTNKIASDVDSGYMASKEKVAASKNKAAGYTGDRNITGDAFSKQADEYQDKTRRKGEIAKGYTSDRLDQIKDPDRKEREELKDLREEQEQERSDRLASEKAADERMALIEGINDLQDAMLTIQSERLDLLESGAASLESLVASNKAEQDAVNAMQGELNALFSDQLADLFGEMDAVKNRVTSAEGNIVAQGNLIANLRTDLDTLTGKVQALKRKLRRLKRKVNVNKQDIEELQQDMYGCGGDIAQLRLRVAANETSISILEADVDYLCSTVGGDVEVTFQDNSYHYDHTVTLQDNSSQKCVDVHHDGDTGLFSNHVASSTEQVCFMDTDKYQQIDWSFHYRTDSKTITVPVPTIVCPSTLAP